MEPGSVFFEEWIRSLREQYKHVLRQDDRVALPTLTAVLMEVGFNEDELAQLRDEATRQVDKPGADHMADMEIQEHTMPHAAECNCPVCTGITESIRDADDQPVPIEPKPEPDEAGSAFAAAAREDIALSEMNDDPDPLTFEDSLAARDTEAGDDEDPIESGADDEDVDNPQQMSLF